MRRKLEENKMSIWDEIGKKATNATAKAVQKTKNISDLTRLNSTLTDYEKRLSNSYYHIGKLYVSLHKDDYEAPFTDMMADLQETMQLMDNIEEQIHEAKGIQICEHCGAEVQKNSAFCSVCGKPMPVGEHKIAGKIKCTKCGNYVDETMKFCTACGTPIVKEIP